MRTRKWLHQPAPTYILTHEVLPYEIEFELPTPVILNIYSYVTPKYMQTPRRMKIERMSIELNHKMTTLNELFALRRYRSKHKD
jgi:hypothetical protein